MARQQRKKTRVRGVAAHAKASSSLKKEPETESSLSAAAVAATFGNEPEEDAMAVDNEDETESADTQNLSRGQRKRLKRRAAFMRKMGLVSRVTQEQENQAKTQANGVFTDLEELQSSLFQADEDKKKSKGSRAKTKALSGRQRQKLAVRELGQLKAVQTHAGFMNDPFAAIQAHLQNTVVQANQELLQKTEAAKKKKKMKRGTNMEVEA